MLVGVSWSEAAWVLLALGSYSSQREHERQHVLWHTEAEHDTPPSETGLQGSIPTWQRPQTHLQYKHCLAKDAEGEGDGLAKFVFRPEPYLASVGHPQTEGGGTQGL